MAQPCRPSCAVAYFVSQADPDNVAANRAVLHKTAAEQTITVSTADGNEQIVTDIAALAGSVGRFSQLTIRGNEPDALLVQTEAKAPVLVVDADQLTVAMSAPVNIDNDLNIDGRLTATVGTYLSVTNPLLYIATNQANNTTNQGWYAEYSPDGIAVNYRGIICQPQTASFVHFDQLGVEPGINSAINANARLIASDAASVSSTFIFDDGPDSISVQCTLPVGTDYTYTIPDAVQNAEFLLTEGNQTLTGLQTFTTLEASGPIYGTAYDSQLFSFMAYLNPSNVNIAKGPIIASNISNFWSGGTGNIAATVRFGDGVTAGIVEYGVVQVRLRAGTYTLEYGYRGQFNHGAGEIYCTALGMSSTFDQYNASRVGLSQRTSFAVPVAGIYDFAIRQTGKNASSSAYFLEFWPYFAFQQTS